MVHTPIAVLSILAAALVAAKPGTPAKPATPAAPAAATPGAEPTKAETPARQPSAKGTMFDGEAKELAGGFRFTEGPVYVSSGPLAGYFVFSDIPNSKIHKVKIDKEGKGTPELLREKSGGANGNAVDAKGQLVSCESEGRVTRTDILADSKATPVVLASEFEGSRLNSPNDLCIGANGDIYFTDPAYFAGEARKLKFEGVYRLAPDGKLTVVSKDYKRPNGICLSPDGKKLYVADAGAGELWVHEVNADGSTGERKPFADFKGVRGRGVPDGLRTDKKGNVYSTGPGGIWCFSPTGEWLDRLSLPSVSNFNFGGPDGTTILTTSGTQIMVGKSKNPG
jgi:gluconolactonase